MAEPEAVAGAAVAQAAAVPLAMAVVQEVSVWGAKRARQVPRILAAAVVAAPPPMATEPTAGQELLSSSLDRENQMAHFARIDNGTVVQVIVISNDEAPDEATGIAFCRSLFGDDTDWAQTSYNNNPIDGQDRGKYAGIGDLWDGEQFTAPITQGI